MALLVSPKTRKKVSPPPKRYTSKYLRRFGKTLFEMAEERGCSPYKVWYDIRKADRQ